MSSTTSGHDHIEELIAAEALGGLDEPDRLELERALAAHGPACEECGRLLAEYGQAAADLALALEPVPLSPGAEDRLIELAREDAALADADGPRSGIRRIPSSRRWAIPAAMAAAILVAVGFVGYSLAPSRPDPTSVVTLGQGAQAIKVAYTPGEEQALVIGTNLPEPPSGKVYELWYQPSPGADMEPAGTFVPRNGAVVSSVRVGRSFVALAVSLEPKGGSPRPTSPPLYVSPV